MGLSNKVVFLEGGSSAVDLGPGPLTTMFKASAAKFVTDMRSGSVDGVKTGIFSLHRDVNTSARKYSKLLKQTNRLENRMRRGNTLTQNEMTKIGRRGNFTRSLQNAKNIRVNLRKVLGYPDMAASGGRRRRKTRKSKKANRRRSHKHR